MTVEKLLRAGLNLELLVGGADVTVSWVHSSDLLDPTPFLDSGELLLTTGSQFLGTDEPAIYQRYVERLTMVGIGALGFGTEVFRTETPAGLVQACRGHHMTLIEVPYRIPFLAVSRWVAESLSAEAHARDTWTLQAQRAIALAALTKGRIVAVLDELSRQLAAEVTLFDGRGELVSRHGARQLTPEMLTLVQREAARLLRRGMRAGSTADAAHDLTTLQTLGRREELRGVLAVTRSTRLDPADNTVTTSAAALAEFALEDAARQQARERIVNAEMVELMLAGQLHSVRRVFAATRRDLPRSPLRLLVCRRAAPGVEDLERALEVESTQAGLPVFIAPHQQWLLIVVAESWLNGAVRLCSRSGVDVGVSGSTDFPALAAALVQARSAAQRAAASGRPVVYADEDPHPVLGLISRVELTDVARARFKPVLDDPDSTELMLVLEVWLRHNGLWEPAARELGVHRHTVKARIRRLEALLEASVEDFDVKAELWMLLKAPLQQDGC